MSKNNLKTRKPKTNAGKRWKAAPSKPSATTARTEDLSQKRARAARILNLLHENYAGATCSLDYKNPFELLIATILSAQCTDARVNKVTPELFRKYPTPKAIVNAPVEDIEDAIKSTNFFRNKARNIKACCEMLESKYAGRVPRTLEELTALAGVGRKTANVVLGNAFGTPGIVVDTHVGRISYRLGLAVSPQAAVKNPEVIEKELEQIFDRKEWIDLAHLLISHGREICTALRPKCEACFLARLCPRIGV